MRIVIMGWGEIGKAVYKLYMKRYGDDLKMFIQDPALGLRVMKESLTKSDMLVVCIPYADNFLMEVLRIYNFIGEGAQMCIIHSTVPVGTVDKIKNAVHIPIEGKHPDLFKYLLDWNPLVGMNSDNAYKNLYMEFIETVFGNNVTYTNTNVSELCKLLSTLQYGVNIEFFRYVKDVLGEDYKFYQEYCKNYNILYSGEDGINRYVLEPPVGDIGGHCIVQNANLIGDSIFSKIVKDRYNGGGE